MVLRSPIWWRAFVMAPFIALGLLSGGSPALAQEAPPAPALAPIPPSGQSPGWFGFALECSRCGWVRDGDDLSLRWQASEPPLIRSIEPGSPAGLAGLRAGDRIVSIDGLSITSRDGGARLGRARPGDDVRLEVERGDERVGVDVRLAARSAPPAPGGDTPMPGGPRPPGIVPPGPGPAPAPPVRYEGRLGDTIIEVVGEPVVVLESEDEIVLLIGGTRVRVHLVGGG